LSKNKENLQATSHSANTANDTPLRIEDGVPGTLSGKKKYPRYVYLITRQTGEKKQFEKLPCALAEWQYKGKEYTWQIFDLSSGHAKALRMFGGYFIKKVDSEEELTDLMRELNGTAPGLHLPSKLVDMEIEEATKSSS